MLFVDDVPTDGSGGGIGAACWGRATTVIAAGWQT
jgi:hypothetical protein